ncbi:MAG TPA: MG2 domain-containing protein, partial [Candidatus Angelobacter sp.]|nr:MG2 domain-containing protein [Candidatus Angelobacter sp.]
MERLWKHCVVVLAVTTICFAQPASSPLRVNESAARIESLTSTLRLTLPLDHSVSAPVNASITLKLLDPEDKPRASSVTTLTLQSSQRTITAAIDQPLKNLETPDIENLAWYRISYEIRSDAQSLLASGIIPIANRYSEIFRLFVAAAPNANEGRKYAVHVTTAAAQTTAPVPGVAITGELTWDQEENENSSTRKLEAHATTDRFGEASLEFTLPPTLGRHEADLNIVARKGVVSRSVQQEVWLEPAGSALIDTDKEIYQPGQTIHIRALMFNSRRNAETGAKVDVRISDQDETLIFRETLETDKFGVAHDEWTIPPNVRLGTYAIDVRRAGVDNRERNIRWVRIYRYDLPSFSVETKPDRPYYLPGQNAAVSVSAEYLFGKPVSRASVRVVEEMQHHWNYREQKWETEDGQVRTGELDKDGRFTATFDLRQYFESLRSNDYQRFRDVTIAAYATDLTTGRTEQRRATLRLTRQPIHVYVSEASEAAKGLPADFFVSAFYADGTPAHCEIRLSLIDEIDESGAAKPGHYLATVKTNRYGLARLNGVLLSHNKVSGSLALLAEARDGHGLTGTHSELLWLSDRDSIHISTPRTIYRPDEPIEVSLLSRQPSARVVVDLVRDSQLLTSRTVLLRNGKGSVSFPFDPRFTDEIEIIAYCPESASGKFDFPYADRTVLYPTNRRLQTQVHLQRGTYRPGDSAAATINVRLPDGGAAQSSLGIKIVDKAVEERSRTDREFRGDNGGWDPWWPWSSYEAFAGITRDDLDLVDLTRPIPPDLDLVAEFILSRSYRPGIKVEMDGSGSNPVLVFSSRFDRQFNPLQPVLESASVEGKVPANERELVALCRQHGVDVQSFTDPWGTPYRYTFDYDRNYRTLSIESAGPDKQFGTNDDFPARTIPWEYFTYYGLLLNRAAEDFLLSHGRFIRDRETLKQQLLQLGVDIDALRDPWGNLYQYRFAVERSWLIIYVLSGGPRWDGRSPFPSTQEISVWREVQDYFSAARNQIQDALSRKLASGGAFPRTEEEFKAILKDTGVDLDLLRDPFDHPCYIRFKSAAEYGDKVVVRQQGLSRDQASVPLTMMKQAVQIMSPGLDNRPFTADDFILAEFSALVTQQGASDVTPKPAPNVLINSSTGVISGTAL